MHHLPSESLRQCQQREMNLAPFSDNKRFLLLAMQAHSLPPPRCVPWSSWSDFLLVHNAVEEMAGGVVEVLGPARLIADKIACWRSLGSLPLAVDTTGQIAEHFLQSNAVRWNFMGEYTVVWPFKANVEPCTPLCGLAESRRC